jgi:DNA polymerase-1
MTRTVGLDLETDGLDPFNNTVHLAALMEEGDKDVTLIQAPRLEQIVNIIDSADAVLGHNLSFDLGFLGHHVPAGRIYDTFYLSRLVDYKEDSHTLDECARRAGVGHLYEGINKKAMQKLNWANVDLSGPAGDYARADVLALWPIFNRFRDRVDDPLYRFDENSIRAGLRVQRHGLPILHAEAATQRNSMVERHRELLEEIPFNPNSPKQTCIYLRVESSSDAVLARLIADGNETAANVREARRLAKSINFLDKMLAYPRYTGTLQPAARSGRFTSKQNNIQNLPREFKQFIGSRDNVILTADFAQLELRTVACLSRDEVMVGLFKDGQDLHGYTAEQLFGVNYNKQQRQIAKVLNFAMLYGAGPDKVQMILLARAGVDLELEQVRTLYNTWLRTFPGIARWQRRGKGKHYRRETGYTPAGRPYVSKLHTDFLNIQNQGAGAEVARIALHYIQNRIEAPAVLFGFFHDAYAVETPNDPAVYEQAARVIYDGMAVSWEQAPFDTLGISMPIDVGVAHDVATADSLEDCLYIYRGSDQ